MSKVNLYQLTEEIRELGEKVNYRQYDLFKVLKRELSPLGFWRNRPRGNPAKGYEAMKKKEVK